MPLCSVSRSLTEFVTQKGVQWWRQVPEDRVLIVDEKALEEDLVELPPQLVRRIAIGGLTFRDEPKSHLDAPLGSVIISVDGGKSVLRGLHLGADPSLLTLEELDRDGIGVVRVQQLLPFALKAAHATLLNPPLTLALDAELGQIVEDEGLNLGRLVLGEPDRGVMSGDNLLGLVDADGSLGAVGSPLLAPDADEIGVDATVTASSVGDHETTAALPAVDRALQVVRMFAVSLTGRAVCSKELLNPFPGLLGDERLVTALVENVAVADDACVIRMAQQAVEVRQAERLGRSAWSGHRGETSFCHFGEEISQGPLPGRIGLEGPGHDRTALRVDFDRANLSTSLQVPLV